MLATAAVPVEKEEVEYGSKISSPCSLENKQSDDEEKYWLLTTLDPKRKHSSEGGEELAPELMPRPEAFPIEVETLYQPKVEGEAYPNEGGCEAVSGYPLATVVEGSELAVREPGPYILEQVDTKVHWELINSSSTPQRCAKNDQYYPNPNESMSPPESEPPPGYSWDITTYCNTVKSIKFFVLGGEGMCSGQKQDMSLFPGVPYFNQYDTGARLNLPFSSLKRGGNACGPSSLLMAMRWNIDATAGREGWSGEELADATKNLPSMYAAYDATMKLTRAAQQGEEENFFEWEKALRYVRSLGWNQAQAVCIGTSTRVKKKTECQTNLTDIAYGNAQKISDALAEGPILISTALSTRRWGLTGGGHVIMLMGFDQTNPNEVDVYDPAGNYFSTPKTHYADSSKGGHYGPGSCGYDVPYPLSWVLAYTTGRTFMSLGAAPRVDPPVIGISDAEPESATAPDDFYLQDSAGHKAGWVDGEPVEEISGAFVGQTENTYTDPGVEDGELGELVSPEAIAPAPRSITLNSPQAGTTLHVSSLEGGSFALDAEEWKDGEVINHEELSGPLSPGQDKVVPSPSLAASIADSKQQQLPPGELPAPGSKAQGSTPTLGGVKGGPALTGSGIAVAARLARLRGTKILLTVSCPSAQTCRGQVKLLDKSLIGRASFTITAGATRTVAVKLSHGGLMKMQRGGTHPVQVTLAGSGVKGRALSVTSSHP